MTDGGYAARRFAVLKRLATICAVLVLVITTVSAYIRLSGAGLGCADWPACYGRAASAEEQAARDTAPALIAARLLHRAAAMAALILVVTLLFICFGARPVMVREGAIGLALLALAVFLAVLGRWTSGSRLPAIALGNLLAGFAMLALSWRLRLLTSMPLPVPRAGKTLRVWVWAGIIVLVVQIALGGLVSAGFAALSCKTLPGCNGGWWPASASLAAFDPWRQPPLVIDPSSSAGAAVHMAHRIAAIVAVIVLGVAGVMGCLRGARLRLAGGALLALLAAQVALGMSAVAASLPLSVVVAHNMMAALLLLAAVTLEFLSSPNRNNQESGKP